MEAYILMQKQKKEKKDKQNANDVDNHEPVISDHGLIDNVVEIGTFQILGSGLCLNDINDCILIDLCLYFYR